MEALVETKDSTSSIVSNDSIPQVELKDNSTTTDLSKDINHLDRDATLSMIDLGTLIGGVIGMTPVIGSFLSAGFTVIWDAFFSSGTKYVSQEDFEAEMAALYQRIEKLINQRLDQTEAQNAQLDDDELKSDIRAQFLSYKDSLEGAIINFSQPIYAHLLGNLLTVTVSFYAVFMRDCIIQGQGWGFTPEYINGTSDGKVIGLAQQLHQRIYQFNLDYAYCDFRYNEILKTGNYPVNLPDGSCILASRNNDLDLVLHPMDLKRIILDTTIPKYLFKPPVALCPDSNPGTQEYTVDPSDSIFYRDPNSVLHDHVRFKIRIHMYNSHPNTYPFQLKVGDHDFGMIDKRYLVAMGDVQPTYYQLFQMYRENRKTPNPTDISYSQLYEISGELPNMADTAIVTISNGAANQSTNFIGSINIRVNQ
ncbi:N-terminal delta endotoxin domain-containing protein [Cavenderia fasciculata]|uniref:N-terminal delta endotoxin domain-containing protein n=1 Tax=Cavenderia fasciculata TaxID=261658 RepID=F4PNM0_CACFS|nr:N-terminal delta endotoxin domain-containing protein [Cavenderia fasciculata]EGG23073.1 N-terminal delta endotoxin domain-containing protein [Cavenderia fasciculata]|eukprot:XP_004360924.1 N-terminal delta endotoxin domain-containing protein [Cavenderia fasciculata]